MSTTESSNRSQNSMNNQYFLNEGVMKLRLDTHSVLNDIESFLRGGIFVPKKKDGQITYEFEQRGKAKMNEAGVQSVMSILTPWISPHTVQGNLTEDELDAYIFEMDSVVSTMIMLNLPEWEVSIEDYDQICDMIIMTSIPFFSRTKDDGERNSYANTVKVAESQVQQTGGGFNLFRRQ